MRLREIALLMFGLGLILSLQSCFEDFDDKIRPSTSMENKSFVYKGMRQFYLYKSEVPPLGNDFITNAEELDQYLEGFDSPESLFENLRYGQDRFSFIVPNFRDLENMLDGIGYHTGMAYGLVRLVSTGQIFGYVRYVMPETSAESMGLERGMIFHAINGIELNESNYSDLLGGNQFTLNLAFFDGQNLIPTNQSVHLTKSEYEEDPIHLHKVLNIQNHKIGYLMYNAFTRTFDEDLNQVFGVFKSESIEDLVIDLRYNGGGSIATSRALAGMITGQFTGQLFAKEVYNENFSEQTLNFTAKTPNGTPLNSLNLSKVYILTTGSTASASELLINCLNPYIDVVQIGDHTVGKFQGSITLYDSPDFSRSAVQPGHTYAMQPLVLKTINAAGHTDYYDGLPPTIFKKENYTNLGELGNPQESLLQLAIQQITGTAPTEDRPFSMENYELIGENFSESPTFQLMYADFKE